uniref:Uncharacterized protein n=1 Tax=Avena sativa TaxID=4498 RepID=A0ACD5TS35_AVESA
MKKVWRLRGHAESNQIEAEEGRKFVIEFSEEGDRCHVLRGGPWQYKMDAFLVEPLETGADPTTVAFTHVPMWIQFRGIPFYLLTKNLAWDLGCEIGTTVMIDNNSRGNISDKFLRARVQLPLYAALRDRITLADEITAEEVKVQIFYERLPNFCLFCGYIGHMEARCDRPAADRKVNFSMEMRVLPVHFDDPRAWYLPDAMGMARAQPVPVAPWRATKPASAPIKQAAIEQVAEDVAKLKVVDTNYIPSATVADKQADPPLLMALPAGTVEADKVVTALYPLGNEGNTDKLRGKNKKMMPDQLEEQNATALYTNNGAAPEVKVAAPQLSAASRHSNEDDTVVTATLLPKKKVSWKRMQREEEVQSKLQNMCTSQARVLGVTRERPESEEDFLQQIPPVKKIALPVPSLEVCLGKEGLLELREQDVNVIDSPEIIMPALGVSVVGDSSEWLSVGRGRGSSHPVMAMGMCSETLAAVEDGKKDNHKDNKDGKDNEETKEAPMHGEVEHGGMEATGPGAAGSLSGANVSTRQGQ